MSTHTSNEGTETPYARAWREWQDSLEGQRTLESNGIGVSLKHHKYYLNRINLAFAAGWNAAHAHSTPESPGG